MLGQRLPWRKLTAFGEVTMEFSCSSQQETKVWRRRFDGPWGELWMVLHSNEVAMICNKGERSISKDEASSPTRRSMLYRSSLNSRCIQVFKMKLSTYPPIQWPPFALLSHPVQQTEGRFFPSRPSGQDSPSVIKDLMRLCYNTPRYFQNTSESKAKRLNLFWSVPQICVCASRQHSPYFHIVFLKQFIISHQKQKSWKTVQRSNIQKSRIHTHYTGVGFENSSSLPQPHGPTHLPWVVLWHFNHLSGSNRMLNASSEHCADMMGNEPGEEDNLPRGTWILD